MKVFLDDLEVQLALGKSEAKEAFDRERKTFQQYINDQKHQMKQVVKDAESHRYHLTEKFEALESQLAKEPATSKKKFDLEKKHTLKAIYELEFGIKETYGDVGTGMQTKLDGFKSKLDTYRISLALGEYEDAAEMESKKEALRNAVSKITDKLRKEVKASAKIDHFAGEINESVDHMKKAFSDLFS
jgi:polyhydroxyalkanoate synthesis regulator phasin